MKKSLTNNLILKILSVFLAILCWIVVININDPIKTRTVTGIKVTILNDSVITENKQVYNVSDGQIVSVKVTGPRTIVDSLRAKDFTATADFMDISQANSVPIQISLNKYEYQPKVTINEQSHNTMRLEIEKVTKKSYDIDIKYEGSVADNYTVADTKLSQTQVTIEAAESIHNSIQSVYALVNVSDAMQDLNVEAPIKILNTSGVELVQANSNPNTSIEMTIDMTSVLADVTVYYLNTLTLNYQMPILEQNVELLDASLDMDKIVVMGKKEVVTALDSIELPVNDLVEDEESSTYKQEFDLVGLLPQGVYLTSNEKKTVVLTIRFESIIQKTKRIEKSEIAIKNIPSGFDASIVGNEVVNIVIEGKESVLEKIDIDELIAFVSVKDFEPGVSQAKVELQLSEGLTIAQSVYVNVNITSTQTQTQIPTETQTQTPTEAQSQTSVETTAVPVTETTSQEEETTMPEEQTTLPVEEETPQETTTISD